jgi:xanthine dehydrogenase accessory factor
MLDRAALADAVARHGAVARVVIVAHQGSSPREAGAAMLVWDDAAGGGQDGTIGGGALEWQATRQARAMIAEQGKGVQCNGVRVDRVPLGPALGQCCGGAVTLVSEVFDAHTLALIPETGLYARRIEGTSEQPLTIARALLAARGQGQAALIWKSGWLAEPVARPARDLWIWGAGHVGRAIVGVLAPLPDFRITWVDTDISRFPEAVPPGVTTRPATDPAALVAPAPTGAEHLILTFSHALDLDLCHRLLTHGFAGCGLIGSASKAARFRSRLAALGHAPAQIARIRCPIGDPSMGKHPQQIAVSVAAELLRSAPALSLRVRA